MANMDIKGIGSSAEEIGSCLTTSASLDSSWIQPPASQYSFFVKDGVLFGQLTAGIYSNPSTVLPGNQASIDPELAAEMDAWEMASDEALAKFEASLK